MDELQAARDAEDARRYRKLRSWPDSPVDYINTGLPWVVHIEKEHGVPTMKAFSGPELDAAIDRWILQDESVTP